MIAFGFLQIINKKINRNKEELKKQNKKRRMKKDELN